MVWVFYSTKKNFLQQSLGDHLPTHFTTPSHTMTMIQPMMTEPTAAMSRYGAPPTPLAQQVKHASYHHPDNMGVILLLSFDL